MGFADLNYIEMCTRKKILRGSILVTSLLWFWLAVRWEYFVIAANG